MANTNLFYHIVFSSKGRVAKTPGNGGGKKGRRETSGVRKVMRKREIIRTNENKPDYKADEYLFSVVWSEEDEVFIGRVVEFPSLAAPGKILKTVFPKIRNLFSFFY